jgi:hypothetical protein
MTKREEIFNKFRRMDIKKLSLEVCKREIIFNYNAGINDISYKEYNPIAIISVRLWESAVRRALRDRLFQFAVYFHPEYSNEALIDWIAYDASSLEKLIIALSAIEEDTEERFARINKNLHNEVEVLDVKKKNIFQKILVKLGVFQNLYKIWR